LNEHLNHQKSEQDILIESMYVWFSWFFLFFVWRDSSKRNGRRILCKQLSWAL